MSQPDLDYRKIRRHAEEQLKQEKFQMRMAFFFVNLIMFTFFTIISWGALLSTNGSAPEYDAYMLGLVLLTSGGFIGVIFQLISLIADTTRGERQMRERAYGRVMNEELMRLGEEDGLPEKAKHMMQLTEDGELGEITEGEQYADSDGQAKYFAHR